MIASYSLVDATWQLLDSAAVLIDTFYLPDSYLSEPAIGAAAGVLISEDNTKHSRFISLAEIVAMGLTDVAGLTTQFDTDKAGVDAANTHMMSANLAGTADRAHTTDSEWKVTNSDGPFDTSVSDTEAGVSNAANTKAVVNAAGVLMQAYSGDKVLAGDPNGDVNGTFTEVDDATNSRSFTGASQFYRDNAEGGTAAEEYVSKVVTDADLGVSTTTVITLAIPDGAIIYNIQINNDAAVTTSAGDNTYDAAFSGGDTTAVATGILGAINTKTNKQFVPILTTGVTELTLTAGNVENFAGGTVQVLVRYKVLVSMADV